MNIKSKVVVIAIALTACDEPTDKAQGGDNVNASDGAVAPADASVDASPSTADGRIEDAAPVPVEDAAASDASDAALEDAGRDDGGANVVVDAPVSSNEIESVSFSRRVIDQEPLPVVLFRGGYACWDRSVVAPETIDAAGHRAAKPEYWGEWRRTTSGIETKQNGKWSLLPVPTEVPPNAAGTRLAGRYSDNFSPDPDANPLVAVFWRYRFRTDGTFDYCKTDEIIGTNPTIFSKQRTRRSGTYTIDGYVIRLDDTDGVSDRQLFVYRPTESNKVWIGDQYLLRGADDGELCF